MVKKTADVSQHILPVSSTMVGVCMTVITVMQLAPKNNLSVLANQLLAIDGLLFLISTLFSYLSIRPNQYNERAELWADRLFLVGMVLMVLVSFIVAFELFVD